MRDQQALLTARWGLVAYGRPPWRGATSARGRGDAAVSMKGIAREKPKAMTYICWDQPWRTEGRRWKIGTFSAAFLSFYP